MDGRDRGLQLIRAGATGAQRAFHQRLAFGNGRAVPEPTGPGPRAAPARRWVPPGATPGIGQEHECQEGR